jgi:cytidylate kinase
VVGDGPFVRPARSPGVAASKNQRVGSLLVITGPPGAGKSTVAALVAKERDPSVLIEGDVFFAFLDQGAVPPWLPEAREQNDVVVRAAAAAAGRFAARYFTVYDGVIGPWFLPTFAEASGLDQLHYVILLPSAQCCVQRVATRQAHGFTDEEATRKMYDEFTRSEIARRYVLDDPSDEAHVAAANILTRFDQGSLAYTP